MTSKTKRILFGTLAAVAALVALDSVYLLGYRQGSRDALDWDFSAVVRGKIVSVGNGATLLRSRTVPLKPTQNVNIVARPFALINNQ